MDQEKAVELVMKVFEGALAEAERRLARLYIDGTKFPLKMTPEGPNFRGAVDDFKRQEAECQKAIDDAKAVIAWAERTKRAPVVFGRPLNTFVRFQNENPGDYFTLDMGLFIQRMGLCDNAEILKRWCENYWKRPEANEGEQA